jgi:hypothetical protein
LTVTSWSEHSRLASPPVPGTPGLPVSNQQRGPTEHLHAAWKPAIPPVQLLSEAPNRQRSTAPPTGRAPRQERPSPPVRPDRIRTGQNQRRLAQGTMSPASWIRTVLHEPDGCSSAATTHRCHCVAALQPLPARLKTAVYCTSTFVLMDALDVAIFRPTSIDMGGGCPCRRLASTLTCFIMLSRDCRGSLWSALRLASCPCTEITSRYLTGECGLQSTHLEPPLLDLASPWPLCPLLSCLVGPGRSAPRIDTLQHVNPSYHDGQTVDSILKVWGSCPASSPPSLSISHFSRLLATGQSDS